MKFETAKDKTWASQWKVDTQNFVGTAGLVFRKSKQQNIRLVQTAAVTRAAAENACVWCRRLQKIRKIPIHEKKLAASEKKFAASCDSVNEPLG